MGIRLVPYGDTNSEIYEITCDGDPTCTDSAYWTAISGVNFALVAQTFRLYGWKVVVHPATPSQTKTTADAVCPKHTESTP